MAEDITFNTAWSYDRLTCPDCGNSINQYDSEGSSFFCCGNCHTFFEYEKEKSPRVIKKFRTTATSDLPLGTTGTINNKEFTITGFVQKHDSYEGISWKEYMLFSKDEEYYYVLAEADGEWSLIWKSGKQDFAVMNTNVVSAQYAAIDPDPYTVYNHYVSYKFSIEYAEGEFDTNILDDQKTLQVDEYKSFPDMLTAETKDGQTTWFRGRAITYAELWEYFNIDFAKPRLGMDYFRFSPAHFYNKWATLRNFSLLMAVLVILIQLLIHGIRETKNIMQVNLSTNTSALTWGKPGPVDAGRITLNKAAALHFNIETSIYNQWIEVAVSLVNEANGKSYEFTKVAEYYAGYEGGESWSEGSNTIEAILSDVPAGNYRVNLYPYTDSTTPVIMSMTIEENPVIFSNLYWTLFVILLYPGIQWLRKNNFENKDHY